MITQNFTMIEKLLEVEEVQIDLEILVLTLKKKRIFFTWKKKIHWGFWVSLYGDKEYVEGVQSFSLVQIKPNLWKECKDGKGLVTEIYYGWTGGYPYMKVVQSNKHFLLSQWLFSTIAFQMLQSPLYGVASKLPAASTMVPVIVDHHDPACVHYQLWIISYQWSIVDHHDIISCPIITMKYRTAIW